MPNITLNYSDCHLPAEIVEICVFGNEVDRCSLNLVVIPQTLENKYRYYYKLYKVIKFIKWAVTL